ncbi:MULTISPECIES: 3-oxoacyl-[acyl-carrier-protein] synthase III C-terminal domain-containing protein [Burkholderia]|uniref:Chalcone/stilbene synthase C-terminal domain-containing protein n=1 Tax=Burkholderia savannae TaxID=1637837 RepID=A0ABR5T4Q8_9BURK|nr:MULTISPECIES: 3-oxoacyl-[acyl-carrier-protein] synthase III C-terminal domain-containing protein [Burkholderia]AOJ71512.1 hypothetical protein WS78_22110 [Burkholderia savannae]AOJ83859.1 hypothetical protein WS86_24885 [Burkholderia savannae]AOK49907.1 hypothetical protein WT60_23905 [Burkholderia sp. MSMB617WGS]KGS04659.1 hypothetical protein X946_2693 [Burkholderia sp. ABCPW 111]KVG37095.1 hypothetical protein WS77_22875 [Burkholderia sp. MSMB0265]
MAQSLDVVLTDFRSEQLSPPMPQARSLDYIAWLIEQKSGRESSRFEVERDDVDVGDAVRTDLSSYIRDRVWHYGVAPEHIGHRQLHALPSSTRLNGDPDTWDRAVFNEVGVESPRGRGLGERLDYFAEVADTCFERFYQNEREAPDDIIHVSCSGYLSPSAAQKLVSRKRWLSTNVTHSYHMGCYGAFPPVHMASGYLSAAHCLLPKPKRRVDVVHTELLSIHGDFSDLSSGNLVTLTLFADGFIKYSAYRGDEARRRHKRGLRLLAAETAIIEASTHEMTWKPGEHNFEMYLSRRVPLYIRDAIAPLFTKLCGQCGIDFARERNALLYAIHPGGPKILDHIVASLGVDRARMHWSWDVLKQCGNMSSATVPHIWQAMLGDDAVPVGGKIVSVAFGPGLTATSLLFEKIDG